ncbi:ATP phosphoribosyltransferase regulatory subunit [Salinarimonas ramus]|uniref:Histidine--tRNA ligase n=1 Tax=Salinarimonas ramus TaxID=690164 RepID=A0A917Q352_9HYPH|nr:ATP phosphoribosyltransferase regulatory subunit [Salinarimonas ramus]GGK18679.1 ATP phosphoribosyltransferase regulatory subunit [Salinarimonas ramus]
MNASETRAEEILLGLFDREGYAPLEPPVLQPAEVFLDLSGEDIRRRMFVTSDAQGAELCLRPEYTIPVCRAHLAAHGTGSAAYCYRGPVFRLRAGETGEFRQAGIESIGRADVAAADAEVLALALEALDALGIAHGGVKLGDVGLLEAMIDALGVAPATKSRLIRAIVSGHAATILEAEPAPDLVEHAGLLAALEGQDPQAAHAFVEDVLAIAGISTVGGRSAGEIAERFLARAGRRGNGLSAEARDVLSAYLAISGDPDDVAGRVRDLAGQAGLAVEPALALFEERTGFLAARGVDVSALAFRADFARNLDYYTGFIFEAVSTGESGGKPLVGGGRYDRLLTRLGAHEPVPAVGCSFWIDRIAASPEVAR